MLIKSEFWARRWDSTTTLGELELLIPLPRPSLPFSTRLHEWQARKPHLRGSILFFVLSGASYLTFLLNVPQLQEMKGKGCGPLPRLSPLHRSSWPESSDDYPGYRGVLDKVQN